MTPDTDDADDDEVLCLTCVQCVRELEGCGRGHMVLNICMIGSQ